MSQFHAEIFKYFELIFPVSIMRDFNARAHTDAYDSFTFRFGFGENMLDRSDISFILDRCNSPACTTKCTHEHSN